MVDCSFFRHHTLFFLYSIVVVLGSLFIRQLLRNFAFFGPVIWPLHLLQAYFNKRSNWTLADWSTGRGWKSSVCLYSVTSWYHNAACCAFGSCASSCLRWKLSLDYATLKQLELMYEKHLLHVDAIEIMLSLFPTPRHSNANKSNRRTSNSVIRKWAKMILMMSTIIFWHRRTVIWEEDYTR